MKKMFTSILLKGVPNQFDNFFTLVKYSREDKSLDELKRDLINFDTERRIESDRKNASDSVFLTKQKRCHNCNKIGHNAKVCRSNKNRKPHNPQLSTSKKFSATIAIISHTKLQSVGIKSLIVMPGEALEMRNKI